MRYLLIIASLLIINRVNAIDDSPTVIHGIKLTNHAIDIQVSSTGCTTADSYQLHWNKDEVTIKKIKQDNCRRAPHRIWVTFDLPQTLSTIKVTNCISL